MVKSNLGIFHGEGFKINEEVKKMISECESDSTLVVELKIQDKSAKNTKSVKGVFLIK